MPLDATGHDPETRADIEQLLTDEGLPTLVAELRALAPTLASTTDLANPRRVAGRWSALAWAETGLRRSLAAIPRDRCGSAFNSSRRPTEPGSPTVPARSSLDGLLDEAAALRERYDPGVRPFSAIGYREAFDVLDGRVTVDEAIAINIKRNNQFARRQRTWFRAEPDVHWLDARAEHFAEALRLARTVSR